MRPLLLCLLLAAAPSARAQIAVSGDAVAGQPIAVTLPPTADTLLVTYRPNSAIARTVALPAPGGAVTWTPEEAGVVRLSAADDNLDVSVRFQGVSVSGLLVFLFAGTVLFGGAAFAFKKLFERGDSLPPV